MVIFVDLEHERLRQQPALWRFFAVKTLETKYRLESISGTGCMTVHHRRFTPDIIDRINPRAVVVEGNYTGFRHFDEADLSGLNQFPFEVSRPTLAICGGFQLLVQIHDGEVGPMASDTVKMGGMPSDTDTPLPEELLSPGKAPPLSTGAFERGFVPVHIATHEPFFSGLSKEAYFYQLHGGEVKRLPESFSILAGSHCCRIQAICHQEAPVLGVQFHPELYDDAHYDGRRLLENFFRFAESKS